MFRRLGLFLLLVCSAVAAPRAVLLDSEGPWRNENWKTAVSEFRRLLTDAGYEVVAVAPPLVALDAARDNLVAAPSLEALPLGTFKAICRYVASGGNLLASGGEPFRDPLYESGGRWVAESVFLSNVHVARIVVDPSKAQLHRATNKAAEPITQTQVAGPDGKPGGLQVTIPNLTSWDTLSTDALRENPFLHGETLTVVWVRGTPGQILSVEWREEDKSRWVARVPLASEWRRHVLKPSQFRFWPGGADRRREKTAFQPLQARSLTFGPATSFGSTPGAVEYAIGPVGVADSPPELEEFEAPILETLSPWYKQYDAMRGGHAVRIPIARARGLSAAAEPEGRYRVAGPLLNPAATRYFMAKGGVAIWMPWPELSGPERSETVRLLADTAKKVALLNGGAREFALLPGEPVGFGARVKNASKEPAAVEVSWTIANVRSQRESVKVAPGEIREVNAQETPALPPGEYRVETVLSMGGTEIDRASGYLRVFDPLATRTPQQRIRITDGHFTVGGKRIFLNGVNFYPRYFAALEPERYGVYWLNPHNYDPEIIETDLSLISSLGMNLVSINASRLSSVRPLMDFLERCRRHGIWANIFTGSANSLRLDAQRDAALLSTARLPGNDRVFAYDLAWEPKLGDHHGRRPWDNAWREWIVEQYGSIETAEQAWGFKTPREGDRITNPLDEQISSDGPHRVMVAAYRRFADDLIGRVYGRVVRSLRALDPDTLMGVRTGYGGTGQRSNNQTMGYDLAAGAAHLDFISPEGYGMPPDFAAARGTGFVTAYGSYAGDGKPVFWSEFGYNIGPRGGSGATRRTQAQIADSTLRMAADSGADGAAVWWWPGWWRVNEQSDFGIINPDGTPRESAKLLAAWGKRLNEAPPEPGSGEPVVIPIDRDADARGLLGMWEKLGPEYVKARVAGRPVRLVTAAAGMDTASMPLIQVGNVPYKGKGPLKYANAEVGAIRIACGSVTSIVENGGEATVPRDTPCSITADLVNTGDAAWAAGACVLHTSAGDAPVEKKTGKFGIASVALRIDVRHEAMEITGRLTATGRGAFGEVLRVKLRPY